MMIRSLLLQLLLLCTITVFAQVRECPESQPCSKEEIAYRFSLISSDIPMELTPSVYKHIRHCLHRSTERSERLIGLCEAYFPTLDEVLRKEGVPIALKYLCIAESFMNPDAVSKAKAAGMWQFMPSTGRIYGLQVDQYVDERFDFYKESIAAAHFLKDLHDRYDDWLLAMAAYNCGPGRVNKAIRRSGGKKDFWSIRKYLPRETQNYVPKIIAEMYFMYFYSEYGLKPQLPEWKDFYVAVEEVHYDTNPQVLANKHNITLGELYLFNPEMLREGIEYLELPYEAKIPAPYKHYALGIAKKYIPIAKPMDEMPYPKPNMAPEKLAKFATPDQILFEIEAYSPEFAFAEHCNELHCQKEDLENMIKLERKDRSLMPFLGIFFFK